jgi:branched-chain amino acid transport system ATP-binding protein
VQGVTKRFGGILANNKIRLYIDEKEIIGLIGPNGSGKSTLFKTILGIYTPDEGKIFFRDKDITGKSQHQVCYEGISCTFQLSQSFSNLDILESVMVGAYCRVWHRNDAIEIAYEILDFLGLMEILHKKNSELNEFARKKIELASALATKPKMLLLDELFAGCTNTEIEELINILKKINSELGITILIVEHILHVIMQICNRVVVLDYGEVLETGTPDQVSKSPKVISAYLGVDDNAIKY